ncbi:MAG: phasin family protein [Solidesulfovibrio sp. DCME]|uniref:phasin family protein n=1 Tax=Solidesulfovibrio sp. DCME TaxID=3447380 RepID=UPI003D13C76B
MKPVDLLYMGLGAAFLAKDKVESFVEELEKRGEMSRADAQNFLADAKSRAKQEEEVLRARIREELQGVLSDMGLATKDDIAALKALIEKQPS